LKPEANANRAHNRIFWPATDGAQVATLAIGVSVLGVLLMVTKLLATAAAPVHLLLFSDVPRKSS
jgi:hypothetical protein